MTFRPAPPRSPIASPVAALSRRGFLGATLATGAIGVLGACGLQQDEPKAQAPTSFPPIEEESGKLRVMDFAGTDDENLWSPYGNYPKPDWTFTTGDVDVLAKVRAGATADVAVVYGIVETLRDMDALLPWDTSLLSNFDDLVPSFVENGQFDGDQYLIPTQWGFESAIYRPDIVGTADSYEILFDDQYRGGIAWLDNPLVIPSIAGQVNGVEDPFAMTYEELSTVEEFLRAKKKNVMMLWTSSTDVEAAYNSGELQVAHAWPSSFAIVTQSGKQPAEYLQAAEGTQAWSGGYVLFKDTDQYHHAHEFVNAAISKPAQQWALENWYQGSTNSTIDTSKVDPVLVDAFLLDDPAKLEPPAILPQPKTITEETYQRYGAMWDRVKAS